MDKNNENTALVSVVVPVYNKENELENCIESIRRQEYYNMEIILVDDGSRDKSFEICKNYQKVDERIRAIHKENGGVSTARNLGIDESNGEWIMFVDPDDILLPNTVAELTKFIESDADVIAGCLCTGNGDYSSANILSQKNKISFYRENVIFCDKSCDCKGFRYKTKKELYLEILNENYGSSVCRMIGMGALHAKLYRRVFLLENQIRFFEELIRMQDNVFNLYAFRHAKKVVYLNDVLYVYNLDHKKHFQRVYDENARKYYDQVLHYKYDFLQNENLLEREYYNEFCTGAIEVISAILKHDFLCPSNPKNKMDVKEEMRDFFSNQFYRDILCNKHIGKVRPMMRLRALFLRYQAYMGLIYFEKMIYRIKRFCT